MVVKHNNKTLYHIQNMNIMTDGTAYDIFVFADHFPKEVDLREIFKLEFQGCGYDTPELLNEFLTSSEVFEVYAEEI